jgi:chromate reductase, NAD(P)H dehydrogenase (quinone)
MTPNRVKILAIPGSLRATASNYKIITYAASLVPSNIEYKIYEGLADIPPFNDSNDAPEAVTKFRDLLASADAVLICSPEYAFGVPGALKNAIDWTVSSGELTNKPVALVTAATGGDKAHAAWLLIFKALSSIIPENGTLLIPYVKTKLNEKGEVSDPATRQSLINVLNALIEAATLSPA